MADIQPTGRERQVKVQPGASIDGAPIAYIVVLAAVVAALSFIPFSVILSSGGSFPMSQAVWGLLGWLLGPIAGAISTTIGTLVGALVAPYTAGVWPVRVYGAIIASAAAGIMLPGARRRFWWIGLVTLASLSYAFYVGRAVMLNGVALPVALLGSFLDWSAILLFLLPTRALFARWIGSPNLGFLVAGLFGGTWVTYGLAHVCQSAILYYMTNYPEAVWKTLIPIIPVEMIVRCTVGAVIGSGVILGHARLGVSASG